ncbi:MAG: hypothetical protein L0241_19640, partial [Planctomycetia bacterium]|nr:hypothetical protein [Planctomycetia bacterium]
PYSLHHLTFLLRPPADSGYPFVASELWLFTRVEGEDEAELWVELIRVLDDESEDELVTAYGPFLIRFGQDPRPLSRAWCLHGVPFPAPGWYEFRLTQAGELLATEPVYLGG